MLAIFKRELRSCFHGMIGAVLTAFMLAATAIYFVALNLGYGLPDFGYYTPVSYTHLEHTRSAVTLLFWKPWR